MSSSTLVSDSASAPAADRTSRKTEIGRVASDKMNKTRRVEIDRLVPHPKYGKYQRKRTVCHAHDEDNVTRVGDLVEIMETRPLSKLTRSRIVRVVRAFNQQGVKADAAEPTPGQSPG